MWLSAPTSLPAASFVLKHPHPSPSSCCRRRQVGVLRGELEAKARLLQGLAGDMKALQADAEEKLSNCERQVVAGKDRLAAAKLELESERQRAAKVRRRLLMPQAATHCQQLPASRC